MPEIDKLLQHMLQLNASDLHLRAGARPRYRVDGYLTDDAGEAALSGDDIRRLTVETLTREQAARLADSREIDIAYGASGIGRFRCNYFTDFWGPAAVFRRIPSRVPTLRQLQLPPELEQLAHLRRGLVLVTGATGSGKTSTLAAILDVINSTYRKHIVTLEDPIEYVHSSKRSLIHQRGMHYDFVDFPTGIAEATREDPDVILIGEMRDLESIRHALVAAEIGALVFASLHTNSAADSIDRIIDVFPAIEQAQVRTMLSQSLEAVVAQVLLTRADRNGQVPATEVLRMTPAVGNIVRDGKTQDLVNVIQSGRGQGMHTLDDSLRALLDRNIIDAREAHLHAHHKVGFEKQLERFERAERAGAARSAAASGR